MKARKLRACAWSSAAALAVWFAGCANDETSDDGGAGGAVTHTGGSTATDGGHDRGGKPATDPTGGGTLGGTGAANAGSAGAANPGAAGGATAGTGGGPGSGGSTSGSAAGSSGAAAGGTGGTVQGGQASGGASSGGVASAGSAGAPPEGATIALRKQAEVKLTASGLTLVSYGGYLNGESFQEEGIISFNGYQYTAFWNAARHVVLARRALPAGAWSTLELVDYTNTEADAHNTISLGVCPEDGTLHLSFDHHGSTLHYRRSTPGLLTNPQAASWAAASFSSTQSQLTGGPAITEVTYPRFISEPGGKKLLFDLRIGSSSSGDELLWEYDGATHAWVSVGRFLNGIRDDVNGYPHGLSYSKNGTRLHVSWCWRETGDAATNQNLLYAYSDDNGRTWQNNAGENIANAGAKFITLDSPGIKVWSIAKNRGLINQEHMAIDSVGRVHVLLSHMPDGEADDSSFDRSRTKSQFFHYFRDLDGKWSRNALGVPVVASFRGKLAISASNNLYAVLPDLRIAAASPSDKFAAWKLLTDSDNGRFFSDPLIDSMRLTTENQLSVLYPAKASGDIYVLDYALD